MNLFVNLRIPPQPGVRARIVILVIILIAMIVTWQMGCTPEEMITIALGGGLTSATVARALLPQAGEPS